MDEKPTENWRSGGPYEQYVGRWSRKVGREFLAWLGVSQGQNWGDVGCGTGALVDMILAQCEPQSITAIDKSDGFIAEARRRISDSRVRFEVGDAARLPWPSESCDVTVTGLVLNFVPDADSMAKEMARVTRPGGKVAAYVWDYAGGMRSDASRALKRAAGKLVAYRLPALGARRRRRENWRFFRGRHRAAG